MAKRNSDAAVLNDHEVGRYANYFEIGHNAFEFVVCCGEFHAGEDSARLHTRLVISPVYAKQLVGTLGDSLARYEASFGPIPEDPEGAN